MRTGTKDEPETGLAESQRGESGIRWLVEQCAHYLPSQGPIEVFVHHNTLHAFEEHSFHDAVVQGHLRYDAEPYLGEEQYRQMLAEGRIEASDIDHVLEADLAKAPSDWIEGLEDPKVIRSVLLRLPYYLDSVAELQWALRETELSTDIQDSQHNQAIWTACSKICSSSGWNFANRRSSLRPRDLILQATDIDIDRYVQEVLIRFSAAFVDQGYSEWTLPNREKGFWRSFLKLYSQSSCVLESWMHNLAKQTTSLLNSNSTAEQSIESSLQRLSIETNDREEFILQTLLSIRGWAGMVWQLESNVDWVVRTLPRDSLMEFLAVQLLLEAQAISYFGSEKFGTTADIKAVLKSASHRSKAAWTDQNRTQSQVAAFMLFQLAQELNWTPEKLESLSEEAQGKLLSEIAAFDSLARRRVLHEAFELHYRERALDAFAAHSRQLADRRRKAETHKAQKVAKDVGRNDIAERSRPSFQIVCCIDDREESFRRHMEEVDPDCETFGAAGFFAVAIYYRGAADGFYKPLCPGVITPDHYVQEDVGYTFEGVHRSRAQLRQRLGRATHLFHTGSRTFLGGMITGVVGSLAGFPLVARVLFPRITAKIRQRFGSLLQPPPSTRLQLERYAPDPGPENGHIGYSLDEMAGVVVRLLQDIGLTSSEKFSRVFVVCGHGSSSLNNPHESAYCCGACAGKRGGPNARAFAQMANDWRVRALVAKAGIAIPDDTVFVGAYHNTCDDSVVFFDLDRLPSSHRTDFDATRQSIEEGRRRNAHERCRRFNDAPLSISTEEALQHVEARAQDISQARPEYNHATNAMCVVGRREWTRDLFLDRRAFLTSYDPTQDDVDSSILFRILSAAIPVCAGINLEYFFSCVDHTVYGSGSKLPHNLVSLLGVMEGTSSDLRTGLYQQMVEIHEPLRLLCLIETTPESMLSILERNKTVARLCRGGWVHLAVIDSTTSKIQVFDGNQFVPHQPSRSTLPTKASSHACYADSRVHLPFYTIASAEAVQ